MPLPNVAIRAYPAQLEALSNANPVVLDSTVNTGLAVLDVKLARIVAQVLLLVVHVQWESTQRSVAIFRLVKTVLWVSTLRVSVLQCV